MVLLFVYMNTQKWVVCFVEITKMFFVVLFFVFTILYDDDTVFQYENCTYYSTVFLLERELVAVSWKITKFGGGWHWPLRTSDSVKWCHVRNNIHKNCRTYESNNFRIMETLFTCRHHCWCWLMLLETKNITGKVSFVVVLF